MTPFFTFLFGLAVGSFLNAVIYRLGKGESAFRGRSYCPSCKRNLAWFDLIPVLSFILLLGKCRYCRRPISWQYPVVEITTAAAFLLIFNFQVSIFNEFSISQLLNLAYLWSVVSLLIVIFVYDLEYYLIPDRLVYSAIGIAFLYRILEFLSFNHWVLIENWKLKIENFGNLENALASASVAALFFFAIWALSRGRWMGFGDVKLAFFMGLFLGFPNIVVALFFAFLTGALIGLVLIVVRKKHIKSEVPFGPFLVAGTLVALLWGQEIVNWYLAFLLV